MQVISSSVSRSTLAAAESLLEGIRAGTVVGAVIGVLHRGQDYSIEVVGSAANNPTFARGVTDAIQDELRELVHERSQRAAVM